MKMPRWLELQAKIDYNIFLLERMLEQEQKLSAIEKMIDEATGYDKKKMAKAKKLMKETKKLIKEFNKLKGEKRK